ncbi:MAG: hypothetical protein ACK559_34140, partial [bacterium]
LLAALAVALLGLVHQERGLAVEGEARRHLAVLHRFHGEAPERHRAGAVGLEVEHDAGLVEELGRHHRHVHAVDLQLGDQFQRLQLLHRLHALVVDGLGLRVDGV